MEAFAPDRVEELVRVYRAHNEPLHDQLEAFLGIEDVLTTLKEQGRLLGLVSQLRRGRPGPAELLCMAGAPNRRAAAKAAAD